MTTTWELPRESKEWVGPITVTVNGANVGAAFDVTIIPATPIGRPTTWTAPDLDDQGRAGVLVGPGTSRELQPGRYRIATRITGNTLEAPVVDDFAYLTIT